MTTRRKGRECAVQILYQADVSGLATLNKSEINHAIDEFFKHFVAPDETYEHASSLVRGTHLHLPQIDELIQKQSANWRLERMASVDRNVLRLASYELLYATGLSANIIIDEAIEIAKRFGNERSAAFVNGVLDGIRALVRKAESNKSE